ncbi:MAG: DNA primase [Bacteroidales bacterium]|nr:DNA primase [Bacteroidales bacterium]
MIPHQTIESIFDASRIEEVVGDFVALKRRGSNLVGLCPFHNERTPSFHVSPTKGIYKCFGCGKAGNSVNFVMEHEKFTYPEALRYLAKKYHIDIQEEEESLEQVQEKTAREGLSAASEFAGKYFAEQLFQSDEGKSIGLSYFHERGFSDDTIRKFQLGYSQEEWDNFTKAALKNGYSLEMLEKTGLTIVKDGKQYDRFRGRVMFPIHSQAGKVIGFGGRIMSADKTKPKYVNSPESEIYNKSKVLYGIAFAKNAIAANDRCFLVEGYTDVISMHQAGIQNVVSSSGTSLTTDQIRLIKRYTSNITILYDGDPAGIKASFRGIDMILEQGMNVKVVLFPDGEDPDSFARTRRSIEVTEFIEHNSKDFIHFKIDLLLKETGSDPLKRVAVLKDFIESISLIPDRLTRLAYVKESAHQMQMDERAVLSELNKILRKKFTQRTGSSEEEAEIIEPPVEIEQAEQEDSFDKYSTEWQEKEIIRQLLLFGEEPIKIEFNNEETGKAEKLETKVAAFIIGDIKHDGITFSNAVYQKILEAGSKTLDETQDLDYKKLTNHPDAELTQAVIDLIATKYTFSPNWEKRKIRLAQEHEILDEHIPHCLLSFKAKRVRQVMREIEEKIKSAATVEEQIEWMAHYRKVQKAANLIDSGKLGRTIV